MSVKALEKLMFQIGITDLVSKPVANINKTIQGMKQNATSGFDAIRGGAFGLVASGLAIKGFMQPVYDMQKALGEVRSLDVADGELKKLQKTALAFSVAYGGSAADFVRSSYDIQSAIGGLVDGELAKFTEASNILAKGTKADAATITAYMGTMYGIFQDQANKMGKAEWVQMLTGQTAEAVKMFKTTGAEMSGAFTSLGANAQAAGVQLSEQMAILGTLQATMSGSEAGTKYKAFLAGVGNAQEKLGMSFTDSTGRMLPMLDILNRLKGRFGETLDVAEGDALKKAFGSDEAVSLIKLLMGQTDSLNKSIAKISMIKGMDNAAKMAQAMVDPWEQFTAVTEALRIQIGTLLLPVVNSFISKMSDGLKTVMGWTDEFPNITRYVGMATLAILGLSVATSIFNILLGIGKTAMAAWGVGALVFKVSAIAATWAVNLLGAGMKWLAIAAMVNPFVLITVGIIALIAIVGVLIYYWKDLYNWFADTTFGAALIGGMKKVWESVKQVGSLFASFFNWLNNLEIGRGIVNFFNSILDKLPMLRKALEWVGLIDKVNPSVNVTTTIKQEPVAALQNVYVPDIKQPNVMADTKIKQEPLVALQNARVPDASQPSAVKSLASAMVGNAGNQYTVAINSQQPFKPQDLESWALLQGG